MWRFSWKLLLPLEEYCQSHLMNLFQLIDCWRGTDEFSWNNFYFIVIKEFWYDKKYSWFLGAFIRILLFEHYCECQRYTNADLKTYLYVCIHIKTIPWKFRILNPKFVSFWKSRLIFNIFYCFGMCIHISDVRISQKVKGV